MELELFSIRSSVWCALTVLPSLTQLLNVPVGVYMVAIHWRHRLLIKLAATHELQGPSHALGLLHWLAMYCDFMTYIGQHMPVAHSTTLPTYHRARWRRFQAALCIQQHWRRWKVVQRDRAARKIQQAAHAWLWKPVTADGKHGVHMRLLLRQGLQDGLLQQCDTHM